ncbi:hypothetical protein lacNasYZ03_06520 [Lactobacillus nasalidis]|uniref:Prepilin peptidase n=1 Tax=Lactobacillus nasalidis TaxID=2797258 RepID=A0ABQ3W3H9_9LACO|nr:hypothetical protein [Lactobacillus nasalidis]GHV97445.1 hypothetical protein lacNasYZ01_06270 [Lactobacillus nasalidis]GHV98851.1 hypothetical protein lacNasYZ02_02810 [Lactobacillus nasalidis]GHW00965.1 hypothetical protein lacNasYZ03_06520 [Lactobacillus nasalidis]
MLSELISLACGLLAAYNADRYYYSALNREDRLVQDLPYIILAGNLTVYALPEHGILYSILLISHFILMVTSDLHEQAYDSCLLFTPLVTGLRHFFLAPGMEGLGAAACFLAVLVWLTLRGKMGSGDVWFYLLLVLNFSSQVALKSFLLASLLALARAAWRKLPAEEAFAFLPYLFWGLNLQFLL